MGGKATPAKFGRIRHRRIFQFNAAWNGKHYANKQIDVISARIGRDELVVTVIVKYF
jgi:hypothetical protein